MTSETLQRVLVVDDEPDMASGIQRILKLQGYEVHTANSGEEAVLEARDWQPDGILMDLKMPGIDGVEAYRQIRPLCPNAFVIFMTAYSSLVDDARGEGAAEVLTKPLDPEQTCELISQSLVTRPVLVVDDDADFCKSLARALKANGCLVQTALSAEEALDIYAKQPRSVVMLDMRLGETNGFDLLRSLKEQNAKAIVIQMSGYSDMGSQMSKGMELSATACFHKPLDIESVITTVKQAMRKPK